MTQQDFRQATELSMSKLRYAARGAVMAIVSVVFVPRTAPASEELPAYHLDTVVIVADRIAGPIRESTWATSVLLGADLEALPALTLTDALGFLPGTVFLENDGAGNRPMAVTRGFYGGGETEYILLTVDGVPVNDLQTGVVEWSEIPTSSIDRVEVLRGGSSAVYGDAALGAVVNVVTQDADAITNRFSARIQGGGFGERSVGGSSVTDFQGARLRFEGFGRHSDGFRDHSDWDNVRLAGRIDGRIGASVDTGFRWSLQRIDQDEPGPLTPTQIAENREQVHPSFQDDHRRRDRFESSLRLERAAGEADRASLDVGFDATSQERTRTLLLAPAFGDTQFQDGSQRVIWAKAQYERADGPARIVAGADADYGHYDTKYRAVPDRASILTTGDGNRLRLGGYVESRARLGSRLRTTAGVRYDRISDTHDDGSGDTDRSFDKWSPRAGLNLAYLQGPNYPGHVFVNWTRAFKVPTLDQMYDGRETPTGVPGQTINISNADLRPQTSTGYEAGLYQGLMLRDRLFHAAWSLSAYRIDLDDEIDFDLATYGYGNIQESRHDGIETSITLDWRSRASWTSSVNWMDVTFSGGTYRGNRLKSIPATTLSNTLRVELPADIQLALGHQRFGEIFLDDDNTATLPGHDTLHAKLGMRIGRADLHLLVKNLTNVRYESTGYLLFDPGTMSSERLLFPTEGRSFFVGLDL